MVRKIVGNGQKYAFLDAFRVSFCDGSLLRTDVSVNQWASSSACSVKAEAILTTHCREKLQMVQKMVKKCPKNRHFLDAFRAFLFDCFSDKVDIYVNYNAGSLICSVKARSYSANSLTH